MRALFLIMIFFASVFGGCSEEQYASLEEYPLPAFNEAEGSTNDSPPADPAHEPPEISGAFVANLEISGAFYRGDVSGRSPPQATNAVLLDGGVAVWGVQDPPDNAVVRATDQSRLLPANVEFSGLERGHVLGAVDLDGDGDEDIVGSSPADFIGILEADGSYRWLGETPVRHRPLTSWVGWAPLDFNLDGLVDLVMTSQDCGPGEVWRFVPYLNNGRGGWDPRPDLVNHGIPGNTSGGIMTAPMGPNMIPTIIPVGEPCSPGDMFTHTFFQPDGRLSEDGHPTWGPVELIVETGRWRDDRNPFGHPTRNMPMGGFVGDVDQDGRLDVGFSPSARSLMLYTWSTEYGGLVDASDRSVAFLTGPHEGWVKYPWGIYQADLNADGMPDLLVTQGNDSLTAFGNTNGAHYVSVWLGTPDGYVDASAEVGLGSEGDPDLFGDYWNVTVGDVDGDNRPEFGVGGPVTPGFTHPDNNYHSRPRVLANRVTSGQPLHVQLRGTASNHLGAGSQVTVHCGQRVAAYGYSGASGSLHAGTTPGVWAGMGECETATLEVRWPSGIRQTVTGVTPGSHTITEP